MNWEDLVRNVIGDQFVRSLEVIRIADTGASGPRVVIVRSLSNSELFAIKYGDTRVPISVQVTNLKKIAPLFKSHHFPGVHAAGERVLVMTAVGEYTLHDAVLRGSYDQEYLLSVFDQIIRRFGEVWLGKTRVKKSSFQGEYARDPIGRTHRVAKAVRSCIYGGTPLASAGSLPVVVNGVKLQGTLDQLLTRMETHYQPPEYVVTCHGDPNADNIMIDRSRNWWLLDWEWVGQHDWHVLASHLIGWWHSNATFMKGTPNVTIDGEITITYEAALEEMATSLVERAWKFAEEIGDAFEEKNWRKQVELQLAILLLGDIRFVDARGRRPHVISLLGEGLARLSRL